MGTHAHAKHTGCRHVCTHAQLDLVHIHARCQACVRMHTQNTQNADAFEGIHTRAQAAGPSATRMRGARHGCACAGGWLGVRLLLRSMWMPGHVHPVPCLHEGSHKLQHNPAAAGRTLQHTQHAQGLLCKPWCSMPRGGKARLPTCTIVHDPWGEGALANMHPACQAQVSTAQRVACTVGGRRARTHSPHAFSPGKHSGGTENSAWAPMAEASMWSSSCVQGQAGVGRGECCVSADRQSRFLTEDLSFGNRG